MNARFIVAESTICPASDGANLSCPPADVGTVDQHIARQFTLNAEAPFGRVALTFCADRIVNCPSACPKIGVTAACYRSRFCTAAIHI